MTILEGLGDGLILTRQGRNGVSGYQSGNGPPIYQPVNGSFAYQTPMYTATANYGANIASP